MAQHIFAPDYHGIANLRPTATIAELAGERGMYSATQAFMRAHGGPLVQTVLDAVPASWLELCASLHLYPVGDVRIHRLYPGDVPAYPGWHCDGEYRETYFSQPDLDKIPISRHLICTISSHADGVSLTEFLDEEVTLDADPVDGDEADPMRSASHQHALWVRAHQLVESRPRRSTSIPDGTLVDFGCRSLHRATPARVRGWRLFFRLSMWHKPAMGEGGTLSRQEQVYILGTPGW